MTPINPSSSPVGGPQPESRPEKLKHATQAFEANWLKTLLKEARPKNALFHSFATDTFQDMQTQQLADAMSQSGKFGLAESLANQLQNDAAGKAPPKIAPKE